MDPNYIDDDLAFPAMLSKLPHGLLGLVIASLIAAYMSTISTHLNWGASYVVHDFYRRFVASDASERHLVNLGRLTTVVLMILSGIVALWLNNAFEAFQILLQLGAGTGLIFILRWFWWRINAYSEISAMIISFAVAGYFKWNYQGTLLPHEQLVVGVAITTVGWIVVTFLTRPTDTEVLRSFITRIKPYSAGWRHVIKQLDIKTGLDSTMGLELIAMLVGCVMVYGALFTTGYFIYGETNMAAIGLVVTVVSGVILSQLWRRLKFF
jgi:Na+/proline symporter